MRTAAVAGLPAAARVFSLTPVRADIAAMILPRIPTGKREISEAIVEALQSGALGGTAGAGAPADDTSV